MNVGCQNLVTFKGTVSWDLWLPFFLIISNSCEPHIHYDKVVSRIAQIFWRYLRVKTPLFFNFSIRYLFSYLKGIFTIFSTLFFPWFSRSQLNWWFCLSQLNPWFSRSQLNPWFSRSQLNPWFSLSQLSPWFSRSQLNPWFSRSQLNPWWSRSQLNPWFSRSQLNPW